MDSTVQAVSATALTGREEGEKGGRAPQQIPRLKVVDNGAAPPVICKEHLSPAREKIPQSGRGIIRLEKILLRLQKGDGQG